ncbi:MAG: acyl-CoA reductase [Sphingorhabdus sp.]
MSTLTVPHIVKGERIEGDAQDYGKFATPQLNLTDLVWQRPAPGPAFDVPLAEIIDILVALGEWLKRDPDGVMAQACTASKRSNPLPEGVIDRSYATLGHLFDRASMEFQVEQELGGADVLDGWRTLNTPSGRSVSLRAFPPRLVHIVAGNAPGVSAMTIIRGALTKGVHLLKLPSNDLFTATAILTGLSAVAPGHGLARSFSAAYWRGGDKTVESMLFRPQFFDKLVAWGGDATIRSAKEYIGPGFELVAFDPKTSISMIGNAAFADEATLASVAEAAAMDATVMDQQACTSSRFQFVEGSIDQVDRFCALLQEKMGVERMTASACGNPLTGAIRDEIDALRDLDPDYRVFGGFEGRGCVVRSDDPVDFHPDGRVVNVVRVAQLADAIRYVTVATQTVGVFPHSAQVAFRDTLAAAGTQRVVALGSAVNVEAGLSHDGFYPLQRFVRWVNDED